MAQEDPLIKMLREKGLTQEQIVFLIKVLGKIKERRGDAKAPPEASVRYVLEREIEE